MAISPRASIAITPPSPPQGGKFPEHHLAHRLRKVRPPKRIARADIVRDGGADEYLAVTGRRHGA